MGAWLSCLRVGLNSGGWGLATPRLLTPSLFLPTPRAPLDSRGPGASPVAVETGHPPASPSAPFLSMAMVFGQGIGHPISLWEAGNFVTPSSCIFFLPPSFPPEVLNPGVRVLQSEGGANDGGGRRTDLAPYR